MRVSQNEIYRLCQRALEGLGAPMGVDWDGAFAVAWLEARNLPGLDILARDLVRLECDFGPPTAMALDGTQLRIDAAGQSAIAMCGAVVDAAMAVAEAAADGRATIRLLGCRSPLFLLPLAARRSEGGSEYRLAWCSGGRDIACLVTAPGRVSIHAAPENHLGGLLTAAEMAEVEILCAYRVPLSGADPRLPPSALDAEALAWRLSRALASGVDVAQETWERVAKVAARVQVSASEASRARGAGGGDANV
jgi:hypothetical protein